MVKAVQGGKRCVIFPEGRLTMTGALMKVYEGPGTIAYLAGATLLPIRIEGADRTFFSRLKGIVRQRWFPKITGQRPQHHERLSAGRKSRCS